MWAVVVGGWWDAVDVVRHTSFRFCLNPTVEQRTVLSRHAGAARFAFNQCLHAVKSALTVREADLTVSVPWSGFDLINHFNRWKKSEDAGRVFAVDTEGTATVVVTGLVWRDQVCQQVFEEAAVDCGRALAGWADSRCGTRKGMYLRSGSPQHEPRSSTPADGKALAHTLVWVKPARMTREPTLTLYRREWRTSEKDGVYRPLTGWEDTL